MGLQQICSRCGSSELESGVILTPHGQSTVVLRLDKTPFFTLSPNVEVRAEMCLNCGAIQLTGDIEKARDFAER